jgi:hypothetical protein
MTKGLDFRLSLLSNITSGFSLWYFPYLGLEQFKSQDYLFNFTFFDFSCFAFLAAICRSCATGLLKHL